MSCFLLIQKQTYVTIIKGDNMLNDIKNNSILIIPNSIKNKIIKEANKKKLNIKIMSLNELIKKYTFDYNEKTIYHLMKKENIKYEIAENYIKNIYYIENKLYNNIKLDKLVEIKNYLEERLLNTSKKT